MILSTALAVAYCVVPPPAIADGGNATQNEADGGDEAAERARQAAIADVKRQMEELRNYDPAKDARLQGLTGEEKKRKYVELVREAERKRAELKNNDYYTADELKTEREAFEENMDAMDEDAIAQIEKMTDEEFEAFLADDGDTGEGGEDDDEDNGDEDEKDEDEEGEGQGEGEGEYNYDREEMSWYAGEGMTKEEIEKERKSLNQEGIDKALRGFSGLQETKKLSQVANALNAGADIIKEIPGWDVTNDEIDSLVNGFDKLLDDAKEEVTEIVKSPMQSVSKAWSPSTIPQMSLSSTPTVRASSRASTLLMASDGTLLIDEEPVPEPQPPTEEPVPPPLDDVSFADFNWKYGGFRGGDALFAGDAEGSGPVISKLKIDNRGLSFNYDSDLSAWGLAHDDAGALACLFVLDNDGEWVGGKFDWISSSRNTRDFENIHTGYEGWDLSNVPKFTVAAFVIVSRDGKKRSNVITSMWER